MISIKPSSGSLEKYYQLGYWRKATIGELIGKSIACHPNKVVVTDASGTSITYSDLDLYARRLAAYFENQGIVAGDIVTMHLPNWWQTVVVTYATFLIGAIINPLPPTYGWKDLLFVLNKTRSKVIVMPGKFRHADYTNHIAKIQNDLLIKPLVILTDLGDIDIGVLFDEVVSKEKAFKPKYASSDTPAVVIFTSGSESKPKGVVHTHNTVLFGEIAFANTLKINDKDICFMASPVSHTSGFMHGILMTLITGSSLILLDIFNGEAATKMLKEHNATWTMGATPFLNDVIENIEKNGTELPNLRYFLCGGAPIPQVVVQRAQRVGIRVLSVYGSTESPPHTVTWPEDPVEDAWKFDGRALPGIEVKAINENGDLLPSDQIGEVCSRGPNIFIGYLSEPDLTARVLDENGWYRSGDLGLVNTADGRVKIVGRNKDMIIRGGQNISTREIEDMLLEHDSCQSIAIVGVPHFRLGEIACAVVVCKPNKTIDLEEIKQFLKNKGVANFKLPEILELRNQLPLTPSGKIQKYKLREELKNVYGVSS